jgi:hypothetical protein
MKLKVASGQVLDRRSIEVPTLTVELTDLGKGPMGTTVAEVSALAQSPRPPRAAVMMPFLAWDRRVTGRAACWMGRILAQHRPRAAALPLHSGAIDVM